MDNELKAQVRAAHRRLALQSFVRQLPWWSCATLCVAAVAVGLDVRYDYGIGVLPILGAALGIAFVGASLASWISRGSELSAAIEIDQRFSLKERVSTALAMDEEERVTPIGQAVLHSASRAVGRLDIGNQFRVRPGRSMLAPFVPAGIAVALSLLVQPIVEPKQAKASATTIEARKEIEAQAKKLREQAEEMKKRAVAKGLKDLDVAAQLEEAARQLENSNADRKQAMTKLNDFSQQLEKRRQELGGAEKVKEQLQGLKGGKGPAERLVNAMKNGDFDQAAKELENLKKQLANDKLEPEAKKQLEQQLDDMKKKLEQMAENKKLQDQQRQKQLEQQIAKAKDAQKNGQQGDGDKNKDPNGGQQNLDQLQEQLEQLLQQRENQKQDMLDKLAEQLGQCKNCMKEGDNAGAAKSLQQLQDAMGNLQKQLNDLAELDQAMDQLGDAKQGLCQGDGENQGDEKGQGKQGQQGGQGDGDDQEGMADNAQGKGRAWGSRAIKEDKTGSYKSSVKQKDTKTGAVISGLADGPNAKGQVRSQIQSADGASAQEEVDPLSGTQLPRNYRDHNKEYFNRLREGKD